MIDKKEMADLEKGQAEIDKSLAQLGKKKLKNSGPTYRIIDFASEVLAEEDTIAEAKVSAQLAIRAKLEDEVVYEHPFLAGEEDIDAREEAMDYLFEAWLRTGELFLQEITDIKDVD